MPVRIHNVSLIGKQNDTKRVVGSDCDSPYHLRMEKSPDNKPIVAPLWAVSARRLMKTQRVTQDHLAENLGVTRAAVGHWMTGRREAPIDVVMKIAKRLGVFTSQLLGEIPLTPDSSKTREILTLLERASGDKRKAIFQMVESAIQLSELPEKENP